MADIVETAANTGTFKTLLTLVEAAGLLDILKSPGPFAVFAPTDDAFAKLPATTISGLMEDIPKLKKILLYHVVPGDVRSDDLMQIDEAATVEGSVFAVDNSNDLKVNDAKVIQTDILTDNGVIHVINAVLMPALVSIR